MAIPKLKLKLLIDRKAKRVLFAEVGKDFVDFLFSLLSLPVGSVIKLLNKSKMVGCIGNLYESVENLNDTYILNPIENKDLLLNPKPAVSSVGVPLLLGQEARTPGGYYMCGSYHRNVTDNPLAICPQCNHKMSTPITYVPHGTGNVGTNGAEGGYVKGVVTYMVMDNLTVMPMSTISSITLLSTFNVENVNLLQEKVVDMESIPAFPSIASYLSELNIFNTEFSQLALSSSLISGAFLPALYYNMSSKDAILLGLTMNAQGFTDLSFFQVLTAVQLVNYDYFQIMVLSSVVITGASAPLVRYLHKSSMKYKLLNRRTIAHSELNTPLRILACIHNERNALSAIYLMIATNPTKTSPINLNIIHFVEIVGHETPQIISHRSYERSSSSPNTTSQRIVNVFRSYEEKNKGRVSVAPYTVVTSYTSMHHDACKLAIEKMISLIILPFHKQLDTGFAHSGIRTMNKNVLENAPCSVGIIIDRGVLGGIKNVLDNSSSYHVAVVFLGGADDREALAYLAERMSEHPNIKVTVILLLKKSCEYNLKKMSAENRFDEETLMDFKLRTTYNKRVTYIQEEVNNGVGVVNVIREMGDKYEMIILGRRHDENSPLIIELTDFDKCSELGTIGDIFETSNYGGKATLLLMQQQSK
ncbi:hypothetical protein IFM89_032726 [Coptis chinensis]|uniref:Uncharacterized protein n=1 Tax=Coptis chinensis TaxID=261450 RepID=A0A835HIC1_9MAGN|nr:hypothetical protein IFM89_032726 [Coptis chinensis]